MVIYNSYSKQGLKCFIFIYKQLSKFKSCKIKESVKLFFYYRHVQSKKKKLKFECKESKGLFNALAGLNLN